MCGPLLSIYSRAVGDTRTRVRVGALFYHVTARPREEGRVPGGQSHPDTGSSQLLVT